MAAEMKRPTHRTLSMWRDLQAALETIKTLEFLLGLRPEKPAGRIDWEAVQMQLDDQRARIGAMALALTEDGEV